MATSNTYKNLVKFSHVVFELCEGKDRHTGTHHNTPHPSWGRSKKQMVLSHDNSITASNDYHPPVTSVQKPSMKFIHSTTA